MMSPAPTGTPVSVSVPAVGSVVMITASNAFAPAVDPESPGSVKPKSAAASARVPSSVSVTVLFVPAGASLTDVTEIGIVVLDCRAPPAPVCALSLIVTLSVSAPL